MACIGTETSLTDCVFDSDTSDCSHVQDAGIICSLECEYIHKHYIYIHAVYMHYKYKISTLKYIIWCYTCSLIRALIIYFSMYRCAVVCNDGDLRLGGSSVSGSGRVEICVGESWGVICDSDWDNNDATVACRKLGFSRFSERSNIEFNFVN